MLRSNRSKRNISDDDEAGSSRKKNRNRSVTIPESDDEDNESNKENEDFVAKLGADIDQHDAIESVYKSGRVIKIHLKNFMCHGNLEIEFNRHINLLVGNNGSGKSAILTALAIGLGAKATATQRANGVKQLIKHGETSCTIEIHLSNDGIDAYRPEEFGSKIIVVRHMLASGGGYYRLKNESGAIISQKRDDLTKLMQCLNIQVENPVVVLNQDAARSFLKDSDPKKLFQLFMKATQIDLIIQKLNECQEPLLRSKAQLEHAKKSLDAKKIEMKRLKERYHQLQSMETLKTERDKYKAEAAWLQVVEQEKLQKEKQSHLLKLANEIDTIVKLIANKDSIDQEVQEKLKQINDQITAKQHDLGAREEKLKTCREIVDRCIEHKQGRERAVNSLNKRHDRLVEDIKQITQALADQSCSTEAIQKKKATDIANLQKLNDELDSVKSMLMNANRDIDTMRTTVAKFEENCDELNHKRNHVLGCIGKVKSQIHQIETSSTNRLAAFGQHMPTLVKRIEQLSSQGKFSQKPRGPLGQYVEVPNAKWKNAIEQLCGGLLNAFFVNSDKDRTVLDKLIRTEFPNAPKPTIITSRFVNQVYDTRNGSVRDVPNSQTLLDAMRIKDPVVTNCFIDHLHSETVLLVEEPNLAFSLTRDARSVPRNLSKVVCLKPFAEYYANPFRSYSLTERPGRYIQVDTAQLKAYAENELRHHEQQLAEVDNQLSTCRGQLDNAKQESLRRERHMTELEAKYRMIKSKITEIQNVEYPSENQSEVLREELAELEKERDDVTVALEECRQQFDDAKEKVAESEARVKAIRDERAKIQDEINKLQRNVDSERSRLYEIVSNAKVRQNQVARLKEEAQKAQAENVTVLAELKRLTDAAQKVHSERVVVQHNRKDLNRIIAEKEARIKMLSERKDTIEEVRELLKVRQQERDYLHQFVKNLTITLNKANESRVKRFKDLSKIKTHMALRVTHKFKQVLDLRQFKGDIQFDWKAQTLSLNVIPRGLAATQTQTKSLSGGERSYSTVALLIALWSCVNHPFYFLDEYDVFTDQVNRFIMTRLLIHEAQKKGDQYAFLTPQDMSQIQATQDVTIHRFADPDRC